MRITRRIFKSLLLFPMAVPLFLLISLSKYDKEKVRKDTFVYWTHTTGKADKATWAMWWELLSCNNTFLNVLFYIVGFTIFGALSCHSFSSHIHHSI